MATFDDAMKALFKEVFRAYVVRKDEKILVETDPQRVVRGTSVSNSSVFENQMGLLLHSQLHKDYRILVDYPIIFPGQNNRMTPDILILRDNRLQMILELKIDLGYEKLGWEKQREVRLDRLKKYQEETGYKRLNEKTLEKEEKVFIHVPDTIEYATVIFCYKNGAKRIENVIRNITKAISEDRSDYPFFVLLGDKRVHPNDLTTMEEAERYIKTMKKEHTKDWGILERYLRNRLTFIE